MKLAHVDKFLPEGLRALSNLTNMLYEAAVTCKIPVKTTAAWDYVGLILDGGKYAVRLSFAEPEKLWFSTCCRINPEAAGKLNVGGVAQITWVPGGYQWSQGIELDSEPIHFFALSKVDQMRCLARFLQECLVLARSIETPDQPSLPAIPEEGN